MKHFLIEIQYSAPPEKIATIVKEHRAFLQIGYDQGWLLMSGPIQPKTGGIVIARAPSLEDLQAYFLNDPYHLNQVATYRFVAFEPVKHQSLLEDWVH